MKPTGTSCTKPSPSWSWRILQEMLFLTNPCPGYHIPGQGDLKVGGSQVLAFKTQTGWAGMGLLARCPATDLAHCAGRSVAPGLGAPGPQSPQLREETGRNGLEETLLRRQFPRPHFLRGRSGGDVSRQRFAANCSSPNAMLGEVADVLAAGVVQLCQPLPPGGALFGCAHGRVRGELVSSQWP